MCSIKSIATLTCILFIDRTFAQATLNFFGYPPSSQACLSKAAKDSGCPMTAATVTAVDRCPCSNGGGFIDKAAACLRSNDPNDIPQVWNLLVGICSLYSVPVNYQESKFVNGGQAAGSSTSTTRLGSTPNSTTSTPAGTTPTSPSSTETGSSSSSSNSGNNVGKLSGGMIGLISAVTSIILLILALLGFCKRDKIEKAVKKAMQKHQAGLRASEPMASWRNTGYD